MYPDSASEFNLSSTRHSALEDTHPTPCRSELLSSLPINSELLHPNFTGIASEIEQCVKFQRDGSLEITTLSGHQFQLFFRLGRLLWANDTACRFRRWDRLLRQFCPGLAPQLRRLQAKKPDDLWEYQVLARLLQQKYLERDLIESLIESNIVEVLFDLVHASHELKAITFHSQKRVTVSEPICLLSIPPILSEALQEHQSWAEAELSTLSPTWSPFISSYEGLRSSVSAKTYQVSVNLIKGELSIRDLSLLLPGDLMSMAQTLVHYERGGFLEFCTLEDFPPPWPVSQEPKEPTSLDMPLIICVDDSPRSCRELEKIVVSGGYRYLSIQDSVQALPLIIEKRPALIFIDLVMPIINGHELCSKVRQISTFAETPIIILTSNDGVVDRIRSKMTGATEFLSKPAQSIAVLSAIERHLSKSPVPAT